MGQLDAIVIGAGIIGLTTAVRLVERGLAVEIWTAQRSQETTSAAAGAAWGLHLLPPVGRMWRWSEETLEELLRIADVPGSGVRVTAGTEASRKDDAAPPEWTQLLGGVRTCRPEELPPGFRSGYRYRSSHQRPVLRTYGTRSTLSFQW